MWNFMLDHWWVASAGPYLAFNFIIMRAYQRDTGDRFDWRDPADIVTWVTGMMAALIAILVVGAYCVGERLWEGACELRSPSWRTVRKWAVRLLVSTAFFIAGMGLYVVSLAATDYRPSRFELWAIVILVAFCANLGADWIEEELKKP